MVWALVGGHRVVRETWILGVVGEWVPQKNDAALCAEIYQKASELTECIDAAIGNDSDVLARSLIDRNWKRPTLSFDVGKRSNY